MGFLSPWLAGWDNLRAMFLYGADFFLLRPGALLFGLGLALSLPVLVNVGPVAIGPVTLSLSWMLLGSGLTVAGAQAMAMGVLARCVSDLDGQELPRWTGGLSYNKGTGMGLFLGCIGVALGLPLLYEYATHGLRLQAGVPQQFMALGGLAVGLLGFTLFTFTLVLHSLALRKSAQ
jgi:hypothetical protein